MNINYPETKKQWSQFSKIGFRFIFIYFALYIAPFAWFAELPYLDKISEYWFSVIEWIVSFANNKLFHLREKLTPLNGSGDTSFAWARLETFLLLSGIGCLVWTAFDSKRRRYNALYYWLCLFTRYNLVYYCLLYGITKLFFQQMVSPGYSQLSTPLGDISSQRLLWMFMGYSKPYQFFTGAFEVIAGLFLLFRRTSVLGTFISTVIFVNVVMLNFCYNVPVKLLSIHLLIMSLFLLSNDYKRYLSFFIANRSAAPGNLYNTIFVTKWMKGCRVTFKILFITLFTVFPFYTEFSDYAKSDKTHSIKPVEPGIYDVLIFSIKRDSLLPLLSNSAKWSEITFDANGFGSVDKIDSNFLIKYNRSYFYFESDTINHAIQFKKSSADTSSIISFSYMKADSSKIKLWGQIKADSLYLEIRKSERSFQLEQETFQWLSETSH